MALTLRQTNLQTSPVYELSVLTGSRGCQAPAAKKSLCGNRTYGSVVGSRYGRRKMMWLALTAITLAAAIGFNVIALAIEHSNR
jgi:hypothetical protein